MAADGGPGIGCRPAIRPRDRPEEPSGQTLLPASADRDLGDRERALARGALDPERAADGGDAILESSDARPSAASAPPTPSSPTSTRSVVGVAVAAMLTLVASACLATFASASDTTK